MGTLEIETNDGSRDISAYNHLLSDDWLKQIQDVDLVICALPMTEVAEVIPKIAEADLLVVDLSGVTSNMSPLQLAGLAEYPDQFIDEKKFYRCHLLPF